MSEPDSRVAAFRALLEVVDRLRGPGGCPWDRSLDLEAILPCLVEEAHETLDAAARGRREEVCGELGDVLLNVLLAARIGEDAGDFSLREVCERIREKLVRRHPHVFGTESATDPAEALRRWEGIKGEERVRRGGDGSVLEGVPRRMAALLRAQRVGEKAAQAGFDWSDVRGAMEKLLEEVSELQEELAAGAKGRLEEELGDVLFCAVNVARKLGLDAETALARATDRFEFRFRHLEQRLGARLEGAPLEEMERLYREAKRELAAATLAVPVALPDRVRDAACAWLARRRSLVCSWLDRPPDVIERGGGGGRPLDLIAQMLRCEDEALSDLERRIDGPQVEESPPDPAPSDVVGWRELEGRLERRRERLLARLAACGSESLLEAAARVFRGLEERLGEVERGLAGAAEGGPT